MQNPLAIITLLLILFMLCGISLLIFHYKWAPFLQNLRKLFTELVQEIQTAVQEEAAETAPKPKAHKPLTWETIQYHWAMPTFLLAVFPALYIPIAAFVNTLDDLKKTDSLLVPAILCLLIIIGLLLLVSYFLSHYEKNPYRKFWLSLPVILLMEAGVAFDLALLLDGYFFKNALTAKRLIPALLFVLMFLAYTYQIQKNWQAMLEAKKQKNHKDNTEINK